MADIEKQFLSEVEGSGRIAAKRLTKMLEQKMVELTINAPDWPVKFSCSRRLLKSNQGDFICSQNSQGTTLARGKQAQPRLFRRDHSNVGLLLRKIHFLLNHQFN
jgi:hypothetical protein